MFAARPGLGVFVEDGCTSERCDQISFDYTHNVVLHYRHGDDMPATLLALRPSSVLEILTLCEVR